MDRDTILPLLGLLLEPKMGVGLLGGGDGWPMWLGDWGLGLGLDIYCWWLFRSVYFNSCRIQRNIFTTRQVVVKSKGSTNCYWRINIFQRNSGFYIELQFSNFIIQFVILLKYGLLFFLIEQFKLGQDKLGIVKLIPKQFDSDLKALMVHCCPWSTVLFFSFVLRNKAVMSLFWDILPFGQKHHLKWGLKIFRKIIVPSKNFRMSQRKHILKNVPDMISSSFSILR